MKTKLDKDIHQQQKENRTGQSHASFSSNQVQEKWDSKGMHQQQVRKYQNEVITYTSRKKKTKLDNDMLQQQRENKIS